MARKTLLRERRNEMCVALSNKSRTNFFAGFDEAAVGISIELNVVPVLRHLTDGSYGLGGG